MSDINRSKRVFDEPNGLNDVADFHRTFNMPILDEPSIPDPKRCELRVNLLREELEELEEAIEDGDIVEVADALADLQYVLSGAILEFGLAHKFKALFDEVQSSNMSKVCHSKEEAQATLDYYKEYRHTTGEIVQRDGQFLVYRTGDKKVLKSVNYRPANLKKILSD
jgi:predicted HAD superfamily Cof-like phosphohydrolase